MKGLFLSLLLLFSFSGFSQDLVVSALPDTQSILIAQPFKIRLLAKTAIGNQVKFPELKDTVNSHFEVLNVGEIDTAYGNDSTEYLLQQELTVTSYDSGFWAVAPFSFFINQDTSRSFMTESFFINVGTIPVDTTLAIKDITGPFSVPMSWQEWFPYALGALAILVLLWLGFRFYKKRKNKVVIIEEPVEVKSPREKVLERLQVIEHEALYKQGESKQYHSDLTDALRIYLEDKYGINALEQPSNETLQAFKLRTGQSDAFDLLKGILMLADEVKFAKASPTLMMHEQSMKQAYQFIEITSGEKGIV